jgi:hypothetical protein
MAKAREVVVNGWAVFLANSLIAILGASSVQWFLARGQRRKTDAETVGLRTDMMSKIDQQTDRALERADRALRRVEWLEKYVEVLKTHNDILESILREKGWPIPPTPEPPSYPGN